MEIDVVSFNIFDGLWRCMSELTGRSAIYALALVCPVACFAQSQPVSTYTLKPTPKTVAWGYYDAKAAPVLRVKSGDTVEIQTLITNSPKRLGDAGVPPD